MPASHAARELGVHIQTITNAIDAGEIDAHVVKRGKRRTRLLKQETIEELARTQCSSPGCDAIAPGRSGRCGKHRAKVRYQAEHRRCAHCDDDMGVIPGSRLRAGRGKYCSDRCKMLAARETHPEVFANPNPDGAREHHQQVAAKIAAEGLLDRSAAVSSIANRYRYSASHISVSGLGELRIIDGSPRRVYTAAELQGWEPAWATSPLRRARIGAARTGSRAIFGRLAPLMAQQHGKTVGRPRGKRAMADEELGNIRAMAARGMSIRAIAQYSGLPRSSVHRALRDDKPSQKP